jgi:hypothetical protein
VKFQILTAASMKFRVFWGVLPYSQTDVDRRFRGACCLHHQGLMMEAASTSETSVIYLTTRQYITEDCERQRLGCFRHVHREVLRTTIVVQLRHVASLQGQETTHCYVSVNSVEEVIQQWQLICAIISLLVNRETLIRIKCSRNHAE